MNQGHRLGLFFVIVLSILVRAPGIPWGITQGDYFEPDEWQQVGVAKNLINTFDRSAVGDNEVSVQWYARGFGTQLGLLSYPFLKVFALSTPSFFFFSRILSLIYAVLLVLLIYYLAFSFFRDRRAAFFSALLLSVFDLNVTYSHYGTPDIAHVFWDYLSFFLIFTVYRHLDSGMESNNTFPLRHKKWLLILTPLSLAMPFALRFDVVPLFYLVGCLLILAYRKKISVKKAFYLLALFGLFTLGFFYLSVGFNYGIKDFLFSRYILIYDNLYAIKLNSPLLHNPVLYFFAILSGTSFMAVATCILSLVYLLRNERGCVPGQFHLFLVCFLVPSFLILWAGDGTFVRRANIFLPYIALTSGYGLAKLLQYAESSSKKQLRRASVILVSFIVLYTFALSVLSQTYFLKETRYSASAFLNNHAPRSLIAYSPYARVNAMPSGIALQDFRDNVDIIVLHETYYGRYWKYFTTPFKRPGCCDEVFHCDADDCVLIQALLENRTDYTLLKKFEVRHPFPERVLFKNLFGTYETFLGDVLIFEKSRSNAAPS
jgi:hypothetical protein